MIEDVTKDFRFPAEGIDEARGLFRSLIAAPLVSENKVIGVLRMDGQHEFAYTQDDLRLINIIATPDTMHSVLASLMCTSRSLKNNHP